MHQANQRASAIDNAQGLLHARQNDSQGIEKIQRFYYGDAECQYVARKCML
jgi:hypothetical protein